MSWPPLDSALIRTNMTIGTKSKLDSIPIGTKTPEPMPQTLPTDLSTWPTENSKQKEKGHLPTDPELYSSPSDSSLS